MILVWTVKERLSCWLYKEKFKFLGKTIYMLQIFAQNIIKKGYIIPFLTVPTKLFLLFKQK